MQKDPSKKAAGILARNRRRRKWRAVVGALCCLVALCTMYALMLPAITMERTANNADWGYNDDGSIYWTADGQKQTANRIETTPSPNTVINLFDYWAAADRFAWDYYRLENLNLGINNGHSLKFVFGDESEDPMNKWVGEGKNPLQGIVANTLGSSGYPVLTYDGKNESLEYLFNPNMEHAGKASYRNVGGLLSIDSEGYYAFDCAKNMAEFNETANSFYVYDRPGAAFASMGNFFPFNQAPKVMLANPKSSDVNHYFGMSITTRFVQLHKGFTDEHANTPTTFEFSGDDDVWIFIDGVLVGDLGGIHDAAKVRIDFSSGEVEVVVTAGTDSTKPLKTTLYQCYEAAGKTDTTRWLTKANGQKIFDDNTVHTLKFFYLERGNNLSNLKLKYNLTEIPETAIYKVNQYGESVPGATFAVYAANDAYQMLDGKGGTVITVPDNPVYDETGNLLGSNGEILARMLYTGTTDDKGEMLFADADGMPYSIKELEDLFGSHFILREIRVPEGYRLVSKDVHLQIWHGEKQTILKCDNTLLSGSRAASTLQITATDILHLQREYNGSSFVTYCDANGVSKGTLFAVVFKYTGEIKDGQATQVDSGSAWTPVWGSDKDGYTLVPLESGPNATLTAALKAAKNAQEKYGKKSVVFTLSSNSTMQLTMENLPGHITTYYRMLGQGKKGDTRYTVAYYWTDQASLDAATPENTHRVYTFAEATADGVSYSAFERVFGANIQVPNLINKVFVQKMDESGNRINGASFAIYEVKQEPDGTILAAAQNAQYVNFPKEAVPDAETGAIAVGDTIIRPLHIVTTKDYEDGLHTGTAEFKNLGDGQYIIKEIHAPPGYRLNKADVMVLITEDTVYANAGTEADGVAVGRGPGYLVAPLSQFASEGQIDNTLTWIYGRLLISDPSTLFSDATDPNIGWEYLTENNTGKKGNKAEAAISYLKYIADGESREGDPRRAFNYVPNNDRTAENGAQNPTGTRRLFTTVGWNHYAILQDYSYGLTQVAKTGANYENWSKDGDTDRNLMHLFSRSTYIRVTDLQETTLTVKKVDASNKNVGLAGAQFRLYKLNADGKPLYYGLLPDGTAQWTQAAADALVVTTGADGNADGSFLLLSDGTYYLEEIKTPAGYAKPNGPVKLILKTAKLTLDPEKPPTGKAAEVDAGTLDEDNLYTYTVSVLNATSFELPETGGTGTAPYTIGGSLIICAGLLLLYIQKKREKEDFAAS